MSIFDSRRRTSSVAIAKDRLSMLLVSDRLSCTPDTLEMIQAELYKTISKYMEVRPEEFQVQIGRTNIQIQLTGEKS